MQYFPACYFKHLSAYHFLHQTTLGFWFSVMLSLSEQSQPIVSLPQSLPQTSLLQFSNCLFLAQGFVKSHLEEAAVSQRDLQRVFTMLGFYIQHHNQRRRELPDTIPATHEAVVHRSLLLSIAMAYYFRLNRQLRQDFLLEMAALDATGRQQEDDQVPCYDIAEVVDYELELYIRAAELPPGIAVNQALRENFYCIAVCMQTKTPLVVVGTPGESLQPCITACWMLFQVLPSACNPNAPIT